MSRNNSHFPYPAQSILHANEKFEHGSKPSLSFKEPSKSKTGFKKNFDAFSCECAPDLYNTVFGSTVDETILGGINTLYKLFKKYSICNQNEEDDSTMRDNIGPRISIKEASKIASEILESMGFSAETASEMVESSLHDLVERNPSLASKLIQTSTPEMVSQILQTVGLSPEMTSELVQTSLSQFGSLSRHSSYRRPSMISRNLQTSSPEMKSGMVQTSLPSNVISDFDEGLSRSRITKDPSSFIPPQESDEGVSILSPSASKLTNPSSDMVSKHDPSLVLPSRSTVRGQSGVLPSKVSIAPSALCPSLISKQAKQQCDAILSKGCNCQDSNLLKEQSSMFKSNDLPLEPPPGLPTTCDCCTCTPSCPEEEAAVPKNQTKCSCCQCTPCPEEEAVVPKNQTKCSCCQCTPCPEGEVLIPKKQTKCSCCQCTPCPEDEVPVPKKQMIQCYSQCTPCPEKEPPEQPPKVKMCCCCTCMPCPEENIGSKIFQKQKSCKCENEDSKNFRKVTFCKCDEESKVLHKLKICKCHECSAPVPIVYKSHCICKTKTKVKCKRPSLVKPDHSSYLTFEKGDNSGSSRQCCCDSSCRNHRY